MANEVEQQSVSPLIESTARGTQSARSVRAQIASSRRGSIHARALCAGRCINPNAVPLAR